jgi:hypothetical protein
VAPYAAFRRRFVVEFRFIVIVNRIRRIPKSQEVLRDFLRIYYSLWIWLDLPPDAGDVLVGAVRLVNVIVPDCRRELATFDRKSSGIPRNNLYFYWQRIRNKPLCQRGLY